LQHPFVLEKESAGKILAFMNRQSNLSIPKHKGLSLVRDMRVAEGKGESLLQGSASTTAKI
jgi:hypothetical protein